MMKVSFHLNRVLCTNRAFLGTSGKTAVNTALLYRVAGLLVGTAVC